MSVLMATYSMCFNAFITFEKSASSYLNNNLFFNVSEDGSAYLGSNKLTKCLKPSSFTSENG